MRATEPEQPVCVRCGLAEVALEQASESLAVASLVTSHLVNGVVDGVQAGSLGALGQVGLASGRLSPEYKSY